MTPQKTPNPANAPAKRVTEATRIPMSLPQLALEIPDIPGRYCHWFLGSNTPRALRAGYEFVEEGDVDIPNTGLADNAAVNGSTDMGTRISTFAGGLTEGTTEPQRLYLMSIRQEWRDKDVQDLEARNEKIAAALRGGRNPEGVTGAPNETAGDQSRRYLRKGQDLFYPKSRKV